MHAEFRGEWTLASMADRDETQTGTKYVLISDLVDVKNTRVTTALFESNLILRII